MILFVSSGLHCDGRDDKENMCCADDYDYDS